MIFIVRLTSKMATVQLVTQSKWWEVAFWKTSRSTLKGWQFKKTTAGFRIVTPFLGVGVCMEG